MTQVALVTGASGAIGGAIADALAAAGFKVWLLGRSVERLQRTQERLGDCALGTLVCDVTSAEDISKTVERVQEHGPLHVLVNNAGIAKDDLFMRMSEEAWDDVINTNLRSVFLLTKGFIRAMMRERYGRIINISSIVGAAGNPGQGNYAAAKAGLVGMSRSLALEVAKKGITVNCVAPGMIESDMTQAISEAMREQWMSRIPVGRIGCPEEVASAVAFLASASASYITGQVLHVNGGAYIAS